MSNEKTPDQQIEKLYNMPHNQIRKLFALKRCISNLEELQRRYCPIFDYDPVIKSLLEQMRTEHDIAMVQLKEREDAQALLEDVIREEDNTA